MHAFRSARSFCLLFLTLALAATAAYAARTPAARYHASETRTNVYRLEVELRGEGGMETITGNITVTSRTVSSNIIALAFRGSLTPQRENPTSLAYGLSGYPRWFAPASFSTGSEIQFDESGRVLRIAGDYPLPLPLGTFANLLVEPLSTKSRWETTENLSALDDAISFGPATSFFGTQSTTPPYYGGPGYPRGSAAVIAVTRKTKFETKSSTADRLTIKKRFEIESPLMAGAEPRLSASGDGEFIFDRQLGLIRNVELQTKAVMNTESVTRRTTATLRLKLLEGKDLETLAETSTTVSAPNRPTRFSPEAALELERPSSTATTSKPPKKLSREEVQKLTADIQSDDASARINAASQLQVYQFAEPATPEVLEAMSSMLTNQDSSVRIAAAKVIADQGTAEQVPLLIKLLKSTDYSARNTALQGLGRIKDPRAAEPLVDLIATGQDTYTTVEALKKIGPTAEDAVLTLLKEKHLETQRHGCNILRQIGTKKSLDPLRELMLSTDASLASAAGEAVRAIMARQ